MDSCLVIAPFQLTLSLWIVAIMYKQNITNLPNFEPSLHPFSSLSAYNCGHSVQAKPHLQLAKLRALRALLLLSFPASFHLKFCSKPSTTLALLLSKPTTTLAMLLSKPSTICCPSTEHKLLSKPSTSCCPKTEHQIKHYTVRFLSKNWALFLPSFCSILSNPVVVRSKDRAPNR